MLLSTGRTFNPVSTMLDPAIFISRKHYCLCLFTESFQPFTDSGQRRHNTLLAATGTSISLFYIVPARMMIVTKKLLYVRDTIV